MKMQNETWEALAARRGLAFRAQPLCDQDPERLDTTTISNKECAKNLALLSPILGFLMEQLRKYQDLAELSSPADLLLRSRAKRVSDEIFQVLCTSVESVVKRKGYHVVLGRGICIWVAAQSSDDR